MENLIDSEVNNATDILQKDLEKDISQNQIKNYLRSTMKDDRLSALSIMNIQAEVLNMIEFDDILNAFVDKKLRKECSAKPS